MAVQTSQLRAIVPVPADKEDTDLEPYLAMAALVRAEDLVGSGLTVARLDQIEICLAAHFAVVGLEYGGVQASKAGTGADSFKPIEAKSVGYSSTRWGQQALTLDTSGFLASKGNGKLRARFSVEGSQRVVANDEWLW